MSQESKTERYCDICGKLVVPNLERTINSLPSSYGDSHLCYECTNNGWWHCEVCHKPRDFSKINPDDFYLLYTPQSEYKIYKLDEICSNECYNLKHIDYEIGYYSNMIYEVEVLGLHNDKTDEEKKKMLEYPKRKIKELEELKNRLIKIIQS